MAPRPRTYGARRSYAKLPGERENGTSADDSGYKLRKLDPTSMRTSHGKDKDLGMEPKEGKQDKLSQGSGKEDESASGPLIGECAAQPHTLNVEDMSMTASRVPRSLRNRKMSAQNMSPPDTPIEDHGSRRKSIRRSTSKSVIPENQTLIFKTGLQSIPTDCTSNSRAKTIFRQNGNIEDQQQSPVGYDIDLKNIPENLNNLSIWVTQLIRKCYQHKSSISAISKPGNVDSSPQPGQDIEMSDGLEKVEDVRMTRGKEKKRLQQLKEKEPVNGNDSSGNFVTGVGKALRPKHAAAVERSLKGRLNDKLKQKLFGSSNTTDLLSNVIERNACGKLLFNTIVDIADSADHNSATVLKSALEERREDAPFISALETLASTPEVVAFINLVFNKDNAPRWEATNPDVSRPSTGAETSGATTITETSGLTSHIGTSISNAEAFPKATTWNKVVDNKNTDMSPVRNRSQVIQALDAATTTLLQIQQGEAGAGYITPYANSSMVSNPVDQRHLTSYGPLFRNHPTPGMAYGPPVGAHVNNYASPYAMPLATHSNSYASPYSNPVNQAPAEYASPYVNPMVSHQTSGFVLTGDNNQINNHDGHQTHRDSEAQPSPPHFPKTKVMKWNDDAASRHSSNKEDDAKCEEANACGSSNRKHETSRPYDEASRRCISNENEVAGNAVDMDEIDVDDSKTHGRGGENDQASSSDDLTDDDLLVAKPNSKNVTPPAEDHKLFTGERLGDFTSVENIDWLLTMGNGGKIPRPSKKRRTRSPSRDISVQADGEVQTAVSKIINEIMQYKDWRVYPGATMKQTFYASAEGQRLAAELKRLMAIAKLVVNTIIPFAESQARLRFYQQLESRAIKEKRDREVQQGMNHFYGATLQIQQWVPPPPPPPAGLSTGGFPIPPPIPSNGPTEVPFIRRGNAIVAPPGGRNIEEEKKAETYGYPPTPGSRPGDSQPGEKRKRAGRR